MFKYKINKLFPIHELKNMMMKYFLGSVQSSNPIVTQLGNSAYGYASVRYWNISHVMALAFVIKEI